MQNLIKLATEVGQLLKQKGLLLATAESCTGGQIASMITSVPGSTHWFERGFVTYSNSAKEEMLKVPAALIAEHGAVSEAVVCAMAVGALQQSHAQVSIAVTGIAGPSGGTPTKPVGLVWIAWACFPLKKEGTVIPTFEKGDEQIFPPFEKGGLGGILKEYKVRAHSYHFTGDRLQIRDQAAMIALKELIQLLS